MRVIAGDSLNFEFKWKISESSVRAFPDLYVHLLRATAGEELSRREIVVLDDFNICKIKLELVA